MIDLGKLAPPDTAITTEIRWVLAAAFAQETPQFDPSLDTTGVLETTEGLALAERIGARLGRPQTSADTELEVPASLLEPLRAATKRATAICLLYETTAREVAEAATALEAPVAFLKGTALTLTGLVAPGSRTFSDIDILVPEAAAEPLFEHLVESGYEASPAEATEQHLPELRPPRGGSLEIHFALRGILDRGGCAANLDTLKQRGAFVPVPGLRGQCFAPKRSLLAAHALVHGFQQHLLRPRTYPMFRMISDLIDLLPDAEAWSRLENEWHEAIGHSVSERSLAAARALLTAFRDGSVPERQSDAGTLLRHLLAGSLIPAYSDSLKAIYRRERLSEAHSRGELGSYLKRKLRPLLGRKRVSRG